MVFVNEGYPILDERAQDAEHRRVSRAISKAFYLRSNSHNKYDQCLTAKLYMEDTHRVQVSQMLSRSKYQIMSRSRRAYSDRSNTAEEDGTRRR